MKKQLFLFLLSGFLGLLLIGFVGNCGKSENIEGAELQIVNDEIILEEAKCCEEDIVRECPEDMINR